MQNETAPLLRNETQTKRFHCTKRVATAFLLAFGLIISGIAVASFPYVFPHQNSGHSKSNNKETLVDESNVDDGIKVLPHSVDNSGYTEAALLDEVDHKSLPGLNDALNFRQFAGYLALGDTGREIFYWFFESQNDVQNDPLVMWTNGGPGCSGLLGLLTEHGPFWVDPELNLYVNNYSWNKYSNIFYIEQPYGVGFSFAESGTEVIGDENAAKDMNLAIRAFLEKFPRFQENKMFISAESYGGHYMPQTAKAVLEANDAGQEPRVNFVGFLVGNPYTDYFENEYGFMHALYGHGIVHDTTMAEWDQNCRSLDDLAKSITCDKIYVDTYSKAGDIDFYAVDYDACQSDSSIRQRRRKATGLMHRHFVKSRLKNLVFHADVSNQDRHRYSSMLMTMEEEEEEKYDGNTPYWACASEYTADYLNQADVRDALHIKHENGFTWGECNNQIFKAWPESDWLFPEEKTYEELVKKYDITMMIFSGDDDSVCGIQGTLYWLYKMKWTVDLDWELWMDSTGQVGGYHTHFTTSNGKSALHFYSVRSAGHMVPQTQPLRGLEIFEKYLRLIED